MANPALKNGYISIATELVEKFATISIPSSEMRIVWVVWRKTWGWKEGNRKKDWDWIALSQFEKLTTMKHGNVAKALKSLVVKRILLKSENGYKFNQNYEQWSVVKRLPPVVKRIQGSSQTTTKISSQTTTNNRKKETIQKKDSDVPSQEIVSIIESFKEINHAHGKWYGNTTQRGACERLLKMFPLEQILKFIAIIPKTNKIPYMPSINTPLQLEDKWSQLEAQLIKKKTEINDKKPNFII